MTYEEFCEGVGMAVDRKCYERIEAVYMAFDRFGTKQAIYNFYKKHDMNGIETLYKALHKVIALLEQRNHLEGSIQKVTYEYFDITGEAAMESMLYGISLA